MSLLYQITLSVNKTISGEFYKWLKFTHMKVGAIG
jgi:hypothetical protein